MNNKLRIIIFCLAFLLPVFYVSATTVYLSWEPSNSSNLTGYKIYYDTVSHTGGTCPNDYANYNNPIIVGKVSSYSVDGLLDGKTYYFQITAYSDSGDESVCSFDPGEQSISTQVVAMPENSASGQSSGGGSSSGGISVSQNTVSQGPSYPKEVVPQTNAQSLLRSDNKQTEANQNTVSKKVDMDILQEANLVYMSVNFVPLNELNRALYAKILMMKKNTCTEADKKRIAHFIQNGTASTQILGAGERAGTIASFITAFGYFPSSESDWTDVIKIANGRWTGQRNQEAEKSAENIFRKIYLRAPKRATIKYDDNAIMVIAYGLRPSKRNVGSEVAAIKSFKNIFKHVPSGASDWNVVRTIAYSGAKR